MIWMLEDRYRGGLSASLPEGVLLGRGCRHGEIGREKSAHEEVRRVRIATTTT